jgi:hypothetical protein
VILKNRYAYSSVPPVFARIPLTYVKGFSLLKDLFSGQGIIYSIEKYLFKVEKTFRCTENRDDCNCINEG